MTDTLEKLLKEKSPDLSEEVRTRLLRFYEIILKENELQNLTRLTSPIDFYSGHIQDVLELLKTGWTEYPALDLGSGVGIPGLMAALIEKKSWVLAESEKRKAEYLSRTVAAFEIGSEVKVVDSRGEEYLKDSQVGSVIARAIGPVDRIYSWIRACSTWNNLILFKGPGWEEEWSRFRDSKYKNELTIQSRHSYQIESEAGFKERKILLLARVPRGTILKKSTQS